MGASNKKFMDQELREIQSLISSAQNILVLTRANPTLDGMAASLALYLALTKMGKSVSVVSPSAPIVELSNLVGINKVKNTLGSKNLVISFPYVEGAVEKVSYDIENGKFNLVIQPKAGIEPLSPDEVQYLASAATTDLIFVVDTPQIENLGELYSEKPELYSQTPVINIDSHQENSHFGRINLVNSRLSSSSEIAGLLLKNLAVDFDGDIATNLLVGISWSTDNFSSSEVGASTFELAALCLRSGAVRPKTGLSVEEKKTPEEKKKESLLEELRSISAKNPPQVVQDNRPQPQENKQPPTDWLKPKIYKGSTSI